MQIFSIGGYGHDEQSFVSALKTNKIDLFVDIRFRRGMRGSRYSFLNATRLQEILRDSGIEYIHLKSLAPSDAVRAVQKAADAQKNDAKRNRLQLSDAFISAYKNYVLQNASQDDVLQAIARHNRVCFFCVEKAHKACHRSIVTDWLENTVGPARHI